MRAKRITLAAAGISCAAGLGSLVASSADAGMIAQWVEVDNSATNSGQPTGLNDGSHNGIVWRTFDLFLQTTTPIQRLDSGVAPSLDPNAGVTISGNVQYFQQSYDGAPQDLPPSPSAESENPLIVFDSYVGLGDLLADEIIETVEVEFDEDSLVGQWQAAPFVGSVGPNENGEIFAGRFTVSSELGFGVDESADRMLGGELFVQEEGGGFQIVELPNAFAIPAPGGFFLIGLLGIAAARRKRPA